MKFIRPDFKPGPGEQPIRGLHSRILGLFEHATPDFQAFLKDRIEYDGANPSISYWMGEESVESPSVEGLDGKISLQESFLSYLWVLSYTIPVWYDERVNTPRNEPIYACSYEYKNLISDNEELFRYGLSLCRKYSEWDLERWPNPEISTPGTKEEEYIDKANLIFLQASVFVLIHEFAHFLLEHLADDEQIRLGTKALHRQERIADELSADQYAIDSMLEGAEHIVSLPAIRCGIVIAMCSALFLNSSIDGDTHPDPHHRMRAALLRIDAAPDDPIWALAAMGLAMWAWYYKKPWVGGNTYETSKENFLLMVGQLDGYEYRTES